MARFEPYKLGRGWTAPSKSGVELECGPGLDGHEVLVVAQADPELPECGVRAACRGCGGSDGAGECCGGVRLGGEAHSHGRDGFAEGANAPVSPGVAAHSHIVRAAIFAGWGLPREFLIRALFARFRSGSPQCVSEGVTTSVPRDARGAADARIRD